MCIRDRDNSGVSVSVIPTTDSNCAIVAAPKLVSKSAHPELDTFSASELSEFPHGSATVSIATGAAAADAAVDVGAVKGAIHAKSNKSSIT